VQLRVLAVLVLVSCGGPADPPGPAVEPRLAEIEALIFRPSCTFSSCHGDVTPRENLSLVAPTFSQLVGHEATQAPGKMRVVPGRPQDSYLIEKLTSPRPTSGARMPMGQAPLPATSIEAIRRWIEMGALEE
jgi:hypothetical protein